MRQSADIRTYTGGKKKQGSSEKLAHAPLSVLLLQLSVPSVISMITYAFYNMTDTFFMKQYGNAAVAGTGIVFSLIAMIQMLGSTIGMGGASILSQAIGKGEKEECEMCIGICVLSGALIGIIITILGISNLENIMILLGTSHTTFPYAVEYAEYVFLSAPAMILQVIFVSLLRSQGKVLGVMFVNISAVIINIIINVAIGNVFALKTAGVGISLLASEIVCTVLLALIGCFSDIPFPLWNGLSKKQFKKGKEIAVMAWDICRVGSPSVFRQGFIFISAAFFNSLVCSISDDLVSAFSIVSKIFMFLYAVAIGISQAYQPIAGYNRGAGKLRRVNQAFMLALVYGTVGMTLLAFLTYWLAPGMISLFSNENRVISYAVYALRIQCFAMPFLMLNNVVNMSYQAAKKPLAAGITASLRQGLLYLPILFFFSKCNITSAYFTAQPLADVFTFLVSIPFAVSFWKSNIRCFGRRCGR